MKISYKIRYKISYKIVYKCTKCGDIHKNIMANDDDMNLIIELTKETPKY